MRKSFSRRYRQLRQQGDPKDELWMRFVLQCLTYIRQRRWMPATASMTGKGSIRLYAEACMLGENRTLRWSRRSSPKIRHGTRRPRALT